MNPIPANNAKLKEYVVISIEFPAKKEPNDWPMPNAKKEALTPIAGNALNNLVAHTINKPVRKIYELPNNAAEM